MIRVAFFSGDITRKGGTERVGTLIANALADNREYEISFVSLTEGGKEPAYEISPKISRTYFNEKWIEPGVGFLPVIPKLICYLKKQQIDILIDIDGVLDILAIPAKWFTGVKLISWEHFNCDSDLGTSYRTRIRKMAAHYADAIVTLTEKDRERYLEKFRIRHEIIAIHNPMDYLEVPASYQRKHPNKMIVSVGRLEEDKGFSCIPSIAASIHKRYPELEFQWIIAGEGSQHRLIEERIHAFGMEKFIQLTGYVKEVHKLYEKAMLYVMTSKVEGLPMVLLEAKAYRLPCISFDILTGPSEIIQDKKDGYLIPFGEEEQMAERIGQLLTDERLYEQFVLHTSDNMQKFQMAEIIKKWEKLIKGVLCGEELTIMKK